MLLRYAHMCTPPFCHAHMASDPYTICLSSTLWEFQRLGVSSCASEATHCSLTAAGSS